MLKRVVHLGEILRDELAEFGVSPTAFARQIDVPPNRVSQIIAGKRSVTGDTAPAPRSTSSGWASSSTSSATSG